MRIRTALREFDWKGWLGWMIATMAGVELAVFTIFFSFKADFVDHWWGILGTVSVAGTSLGACQWIWLRRRLPKAWWWIVSTLLGWFLAALLVTVLDVDHSNATGVLSQLLGLIQSLSIPLAFSLPQWFWIRRQVQKSAWLWIVARPFAWLAGIGLFFLSDWLGILPEPKWSYDMSNCLVLAIIAAVFGFGFAAVTGTAFTWIQTSQAVLSAEVVRSAVYSKP